MVRREESSADRASGTAQMGFHFFEPLEVRRLMTSLPDYTSFVHTAGMEFNGYAAGSAVTVHHALQITDGGLAEARSAFYTSLVNVGSFSTTFSFATTKAVQSADGFTFTLTRKGPTSLGYDGHDLGYAGIKDSVGIGFNLYNYSAYGSEFGFLAKGVVPVTTTGMGSVNLHDGDTFTCTLTYDGTTLTAKVVDTGNPSDVFTDSEKINIPDIIGGSTAYVGFTGATGVQYSTQEITNWTYGYGPSISSVSASPTTVTKHASVLTAIASDPTGTKDLIYSWNEISAPAGARAATFSTNISDLDDTTVTVFTDGDYVFQVTVKDKNGYTATDDVDIVKTGT
jgi:hypothetical protein